VPREIHIIDAFAQRPFSGNPAAVCVLEKEAGDEWMQAVAAEMNLSETAFLLGRGSGEWSLRWFTPKIEVDLCGHATLAAAHMLWQEMQQPHEVLRFHTRSGLLAAECKDGWISLDFPSDPPVTCEVTSAMTQALGLCPVSAAKARNKYLLELPTEEDVRNLQPDMGLVARLDALGVIVTAACKSGEVDFVSRFFAPAAGVDEDPVTGSAHCVLAPWWSGHLNRQQLIGYQASPRGGQVGMHLRDDRVELLGQAITVLKGRFFL